MNRCPKFDTCTAPFCPLDPNRANTTTREGEASCLYLREAVKGREIPAALKPAVDEALRMVLAGEEGGRGLRKALKQASKWGSSRRRETSL